MMDTVVQTTTDPFALVVQGLIQLRQMRRDGRADTDEAEHLRIEMDHAWYQLSSEQIDRANGIAADLFMLSGEEIVADVPAEQRAEAWLKPQLDEALATNQVWRLLHLLRHGPAWMPGDELALERARAYEKLGLAALAALFYRYAWHCRPRPEYLMLALSSLEALGRWDEVIEVAERLLSDAEAGLPVLGMVGHALLLTAHVGAASVPATLLDATEHRLRMALQTSPASLVDGRGLATMCLFVLSFLRPGADRAADLAWLQQPLAPILASAQARIDVNRAA